MVEDHMGEDPNSYYICSYYWTAGDKELDDWMQTSLFAGQHDTHYDIVQLEFTQLETMDPVAYCKHMQMICTPILRAHLCTGQFLGSKIVLGMLPFWRELLFTNYQAKVKKVYLNTYELSQDIKNGIWFINSQWWWHQL
jgi:hypothetical protein